MIMIAVLFTIKMKDDHDLGNDLDPDVSIYMYKARMTILTNLNNPDCHNRPQNTLRFYTIK